MKVTRRSQRWPTMCDW